MRLVKTCGACPEQYDVFDGPVNIGYLRLRWGTFTAFFCPNGDLDADSYVVYKADVGNGLTGAFPDEKQRKKHIQLALKGLRQARREERKA